MRDLEIKLCSKKLRLYGIAQCCDQKRSLLSQENDNFASISDKIKNTTYRSSNHKFSQSLERKFRSIVSSCLRYGLCQEFVHSSVISPATWIFSAATRIDLSTIFLPGKEMSYAALFINNSDLLFAKQLLQSANEK